MSYRDLKSYQSAIIVYDLTVAFCKKYMTYKSNKSYRTYDQMVQAARSGKQNIVEGSSERTSKKSELKLLGVARASLQELLEDFEDFLRQHDFGQWQLDSKQAKEVRQLAYMYDRSNKSYKSYLEDSELAANAIICVINQTNYLLDQQIRALEQEFVTKGGYMENLTKKRMEERKRQAWRNIQRRNFG